VLFEFFLVPVLPEFLAGADYIFYRVLKKFSPATAEIFYQAMTEFFKRQHHSS